MFLSELKHGDVMRRRPIGGTEAYRITPAVLLDDFVWPVHNHLVLNQFIEHADELLF